MHHASNHRLHATEFKGVSYLFPVLRAKYLHSENGPCGYTSKFLGSSFIHLKV